jgi:DNA-directed RNA polymerase subunit N (RpoN/RPB10)
MYPYILCFCGKSIGDLYPAYKAVVEKRKKIALRRLEEQDSLPNNRPEQTVDNFAVGDVLTGLGLAKDCCRARMMSQVEFKTLY